MGKINTCFIVAGLFCGFCNSSPSFGSMSLIHSTWNETTLTLDGHSLQDVGTVIDSANILLDSIINLGKKLWTIIEANQAVVSLTLDRANALPQGVNSWEQMQDWKTPSSRLFRVTYTNFIGMNVVDFTYRLIFTYGGTVGGKGLYLTQIGILPAELMVRSGYHFSVRASVPGVTNAGSQLSPISAAEVQVAWTLESAGKHIEGSQSYYLRGDGYFEDMSGQLDSNRIPVNLSPTTNSNNNDSTGMAEDTENDPYSLQLRIN